MIKLVVNFFCCVGCKDMYCRSVFLYVEVYCLFVGWLIVFLGGDCIDEIGFFLFLG